MFPVHRRRRNVDDRKRLRRRVDVHDDLPRGVRVRDERLRRPGVEERHLVRGPQDEVHARDGAVVTQCVPEPLRGDELGLFRVVDVVVELGRKRLLVGIVVDDYVHAVLERLRVRRVHLVDEDERARRQRLESTEVAFPVRRVARHHDPRGAHGVKVLVVDLAPPGVVHLAGDAPERLVLVEVFGDPRDDARPRRLLRRRPVRTDDCERALDGGHLPRVKVLI
mmetsp:Transcript_31694/g.109599  ORF Transcript_31694/g.109599 Transcript_31694/m.109599 type:complete len:223 (-) Transcript_31694:493-1161(-)